MTDQKGSVLLIILGIIVVMIIATLGYLIWKQGMVLKPQLATPNTTNFPISILALYPASSSAGSEVTINGKGFSADNTVIFKGINSSFSDFEIASGTQNGYLSFITPINAPLGIYTLSVNNGSEVSPTQNFTILPTPPSYSFFGKTYMNKKYGLSFQYPAADMFVIGEVPSYDDGSMIGPIYYVATSTDFPNSGAGAIILGAIEIPHSAFPNTDLSEALLGVSVNPTITNSSTCDQVDYAGPGGWFTQTVNGIVYYESVDGLGAAEGATGAYDTAHTFKNGICYEFTLGDTSDNDGMIPYWNSALTLSNFLSGISFLPPSN